MGGVDDEKVVGGGGREMRVAVWFFGFFWFLGRWRFLDFTAVWLRCVGPSLILRWSISVAPVRGGTYFLCMLQRK